MSDMVFQPTSAKPVFVRPLDKGMILNVPSQSIPDGGFVQVKDLIAGPEGLRRRPGSGGLGLNEVIPYTPSDMIAVWRTDGLQKLIIVTRNTLYVLDLSTGMNEVIWKWDTGTVTIAGTSVTGSSTTWLTGDVKSGDILRTADGEAVIDTITGDGSLVLKTAGTLVNGAGQTYYIQRTFAPGAASQPVFDMLEGYMMIADGKRPLMRYDPLGNTLGYWTTDVKKKINQAETTTYSTGTVSVLVADLSILVGAGGASFTTGTTWVGKIIEVVVGGFAYRDTIASVTDSTNLVFANPGFIPVCAASTYKVITTAGIDFVPACCCGFAGRAWVGYTVDATDGERRQRIRWSALADTSDFSISTNYQDLPFTATPLLRLIPLGDTLAAYFGDAIYLGMPTNNPLIPYQFQRVETGGVGLVGPKAVISWLGGHFFVGQDDIYLLTTNGIQKIGSSVHKQTIKTCTMPEYIRVQADPQRFRVLFGFPTNADYVSKVWSYEYRAKAWSYDDIQTYMVANPVVTNSLSWDGLSGNTWDTLSATYLAWDSMKAGSTARSIYYEGAGKIWQVDEAQALDRGSIIISPTFVTKDYDFDLPDSLKVVTGFNVKVDCEGGSVPAGGNPLQIKIEVSTNRGTTWKACGTIYIAPNKDEGWVSFRCPGSTFRFRGSVTGTPPATPYTITEHGMRVRLAGSELAYGGHKA